jgi:DNA (cytosine-5)-methyltransferase 1
MITEGSDFSGVGAFQQALIRLEVKFKTVFACDMDKYARQSFIANYGEPEYYPENVYDREIPKESLDIYVTSPPCQGFSIAGKRKGSILFFNSLEFIEKNKPRFFIFENVKGLLSHEGGKTFGEWVRLLGGKSVNGLPLIFPDEDSVPYHIYHKVLNSKHYGVPQNRERIFIIGIRDDVDNSFSWPKIEPLTKKLKDVLESEVDEKYFLSDKLINTLFNTSGGKNGQFDPAQCCNIEKTSQAITARYAKMGRQDPYIEAKSARIIGRNPDNLKSRKSGEKTKQMLEINEDYEVTNTLTTVQKDNVIQLSSSKESGGAQPYKQNRIYDAKGVILTLDTECGRPSYLDDAKIRRLTPIECFRLMSFPDSFVENCKKVGISDTQLYKQAGNSIVVDVLAKIIDKLPLNA